MHDEPAPQFRERKVDGRAGGLVGGGGDRAAGRSMDPDRIGAGRGDLAGDGQHLMRPPQTMAEEFGCDRDAERFHNIVCAGVTADGSDVECWSAAKPLADGGLRQTEEACQVAVVEGHFGLLSVTQAGRHDCGDKKGRPEGRPGVRGSVGVKPANRETGRCSAGAHTADRAGG